MTIPKECKHVEAANQEAGRFNTKTMKPVTFGSDQFPNYFYASALYCKFCPNFQKTEFQLIKAEKNEHFFFRGGWPPPIQWEGKHYRLNLICNCYTQPPSLFLLLSLLCLSCCDPCWDLQRNIYVEYAKEFRGLCPGILQLSCLCPGGL